MKLGFDIHGVLDENPEYFQMILRFLKEQTDHEIYIVSAPPFVDLIQELDKMGYSVSEHYDHIRSVVDFLQLKSGVNMWQDERGRWWTDDTTWWSSKAQICQQNGIEIMIDDSLQYKEYFNGNCMFMHYDYCDMEKCIHFFSTLCWNISQICKFEEILGGYKIIAGFTDSSASSR